MTPLEKLAFKAVTPPTLSDLPKELQYTIARKLDVDSRRVLGIYTKLKIPKTLHTILSNALQIPRTLHNDCIVPLGDKYILVKGFDPLIKNLIDYRVVQDKKEYHMVWCILDED